MKYLIFDVDGTLLDSMDMWEQADRAFFEAHRYPYAPEISETVKTMSLQKSSEYFCSLLCEEGLTPEMVTQEVTKLCIGEYEEKIPAKPFVLPFLKEAKKAGYEMCVATASMRKPIEIALKRLGMLDFFSFILTADDVNAGKTDPAIFLECARRFGAHPEEIWVFEDAPHAIKTAAAAGFRVIGVKDPSNEGKEQELLPYCTQFISSFADLLEEEKSIFFC